MRLGMHASVSPIACGSSARASECRVYAPRLLWLYSMASPSVPGEPGGTVDILYTRAVAQQMRCASGPHAFRATAHVVLHGGVVTGKREGEGGVCVCAYVCGWVEGQLSLRSIQRAAYLSASAACASGDRGFVGDGVRTASVQSSPGCSDRSGETLWNLDNGLSRARTARARVR